MNYQRIYNEIIGRAVKRNLKKSKELYVESHHIIPKSLGGTNKKDNLVNLTAREHYMAHWLLYKMYKGSPQGRKMLHAWNRMCCIDINNVKKYTSHSFKYARELHSKSMSGKNNPYYGQPLPDSIKKKLSKVIKEKYRTGELSTAGEKNGMYGRTVSEETKRKALDTRTKNGNLNHSEETKKKMSEAAKGVPKTDSTKKKMSEAAKKLVTCNYCSAIMNIGNINRYHNNNCKYK